MPKFPSRAIINNCVLFLILTVLLSFLALMKVYGEDAPARGIATDGEVINVVDGDTIDLKVSYVIRVRLLDCWAPESRTLDLKEKQRGLAAKAYMKSLIQEQPNVRLHVPGGNSLADVMTFNRILGKVWRISEDGVPEKRDLSEMMVRARHATSRKGGR